MNKIAYVFDGDGYTCRMFSKAGWSLHGVDTDEEPSLIVFTGGEDVTPAYYGEKNVTSACNPHRDAEEKEIFDRFPDTPKVGICRGGQFLNVLSGGRMFQDTDGHGRYHDLKDLLTGKTHFVSSTHHQMMRPSEEGQLVAIARESSYRLADQMHQEWGPHDGGYSDDIEVVYYPRTKSLCFQPHPEYPDAKGTETYFFELLERFFKFDQEKIEKDMESIWDDAYDNFDGAFGA